MIEIDAVLRVVSGKPGNIIQFPWQIALLIDSSHQCGGSIISPTWVLTAAHCTMYVVIMIWKSSIEELTRNLISCLNSSGRDLNSLSVRVGSSWHGAYGEVINISRIVDHPKYSYYNYDFSLIQLAKTLHFDEKTKPIALPDADTQIADGTMCTTTGWGNLIFTFTKKRRNKIRFHLSIRENTKFKWIKWFSTESDRTDYKRWRV